MNKCQVYHAIVIAFSIAFSTFNFIKYKKIFLSVRTGISLLLTSFPLATLAISIVHFAYWVKECVERGSGAVIVSRCEDIEIVMILALSTLQTFILVIRPKWFRKQRKEDAVVKR